MKILKQIPSTKTLTTSDFSSTSLYFVFFNWPQENYPHSERSDSIFVWEKLTAIKYLVRIRFKEYNGMLISARCSTQLTELRCNMIVLLFWISPAPAPAMTMDYTGPWRNFNLSKLSVTVPFRGIYKKNPAPERRHSNRKLKRSFPLFLRNCPNDLQHTKFAKIKTFFRPG